MVRESLLVEGCHPINLLSDLSSLIVPQHLQFFILIALLWTRKMVQSINHQLNLLTDHSNLKNLTATLKHNLIPLYNTCAVSQIGYFSPIKHACGALTGNIYHKISQLFFYCLGNCNRTEHSRQHETNNSLAKIYVCYTCMLAHLTSSVFFLCLVTALKINMLSQHVLLSMNERLTLAGSITI